MKLNIPEYVENVMNILNDNGFEAYVVGGAVRDAMLGNTPDDWDVTTNAVADQIKTCFEHYFETGIKHGTITVISHNKPVEITTYRIDGKYKDNRRPENVRFTTNICEDLKRRDFTINAMAYNHETGLVDLYGGTEDLKNGIIRCVGDADTRFGEDALRIIRAVRFAVRLGFDIDDDTFKSVKKNCRLLKNISAERIQVEFLKMLETEDDLHLLFESGVAEYVFPEVNYDKISLNVPCDKEIKLAAFLYFSEDTREFFNRLKFDNITKNNVLKILQCSREDLIATEYGVKKALGRYGDILFEKMLYLLQCYGKNIDELMEIFNRVKAEPYLVKHLDITGNDLIKIGVIGKEIGEVMSILLDMVMKKPELNSKDVLLDIALSLKM